MSFIAKFLHKMCDCRNMIARSVTMSSSLRNPPDFQKIELVNLELIFICIVLLIEDAGFMPIWYRKDSLNEVRKHSNISSLIEFFGFTNWVELIKLTFEVFHSLSLWILFFGCFVTEIRVYLRIILEICNLVSWCVIL